MKRRPPVALALVTALTACGASSRPQEAPAAYTTSSGAAPAASASNEGDLDRRRSPAPVAMQPQTPAQELPAAIQAAPVIAGAATTPTFRPAPPISPSSVAPDPDSAQGGGDAIAAQEDLIRRNDAALAAALGECRTICAAAGNICVAAGEICRLTTDRDLRCERARARCNDAGRRRDGTCPTCPSPR